MAFYTANYIKQLVKEEHDEILHHLKIKGNDFRSFIDANIPFVLYLDISEIETRILKDNKAIINLSKLMEYPDTSIIVNAFHKTYVKIINEFITSKTLQHIDEEELEQKLNSLALAEDTGQSIKSTLQRFFSKTTILDTLSKKDSRVVILYPRFTTLKFGEIFRRLFDYSEFSDLLSDNLNTSPRNFIQNYLNKNFQSIQNVGHIEVEVQSAESAEIIRGLVSPRLLQGLVELPKDIKPEKIAREFSKETGQFNTRLVIKKTFTRQKLVMQMLVSHGFSIGTLESQEQNLGKATLERKFRIGENLTRRIVESKGNLLLNLVTSKSILQFTGEEILNTIANRKPITYTSNSTIESKIPVSVQTVKLKTKRPSKPINHKSYIKNLKGQFSSVVKLEALLRARLALQIEKNMGKGNAHNVLNYRTGRFANTASIERVTTTRDGALSVFYNYMKYPYATFSEGGEQQWPRTRDPKLLISKSIREIGASLVSNRMRAILV